MQRRNLIKLSFGLLGSLSLQRFVHAAWPSAHFAVADFNEQFSRVIGNQPIFDSQDIHLTLPSIAENGAVVPLTIESTLEGIDSIMVWVEKNPTPLAASFTLSSQALPYVTTRIKMAESGHVIVIARHATKWLGARQWVQVMQGGCGTG